MARECYNWYLKVEAREAVEHLTVHRMVPQRIIQSNTAPVQRLKIPVLYLIVDKETEVQVQVPR